jgi:hypothetical protein
MNLSAVIVTMIASVVIPAITALLTKATASVGIKQAVTGLLSAVSGLLAVSTQIDGTAVISKPAVVLAIGTFLSAQAAYWGLWRPHELNAKVAPAAGLG